MYLNQVLELPITERLAVIVNWIDNNPIEAAKLILEEIEFKVVETEMLKKIDMKIDELSKKYQLKEAAE